MSARSLEKKSMTSPDRPTIIMAIATACQCLFSVIINTKDADKKRKAAVYLVHVYKYWNPETLSFSE